MHAGFGECINRLRATRLGCHPTIDVVCFTKHMYLLVVMYATSWSGLPGGNTCFESRGTLSSSSHVLGQQTVGITTTPPCRQGQRPCAVLHLSAHEACCLAALKLCIKHMRIYLHMHGRTRAHRYTHHYPLFVYNSAACSEWGLRCVMQAALLLWQSPSLPCCGRNSVIILQPCLLVVSCLFCLWQQAACLVAFHGCCCV